jgi:hypothetical protein
MTRTMLRTVPLLALALAGCSASTASTPKTPSILPLRSLRLYETGVGYFERSGGVDPQSATSLPVPAGHLDDALKSMVILSADGKTKVQALEFGSSMSKGMARALAGLPTQGDPAIRYRDLLVSLKGASLVLTTAHGTTSGRLIEVTDEPPEEKPKTEKKEEGKAEEASVAAVVDPGSARLGLLVLTDTGEVKRFRSSEILSVKPSDPAFATRIGAALDALSTRSAQTTRPLRLLADAGGKVTFGYVAETPIWRSTYRLIVGEDGKNGRLQGWALLHNDTDEDWKSVRLELVNGRPDSFLFPLAAPRYSRRSLLHPDEPLSTVPQLLDSTPDSMWGDDGIGLGDIGTIGHGSGTGSGMGYGSGHGRLSGSGSGGGGVGSSNVLSVGNLAELAPATGVEAGALFTYTVGTPVSLAARSSSLVPFLEQPVTVDAVTWIDGPSGTPRSAVRFLNGTGQTLPAGTIAFFGAGGFSGESTLDRLKPGERRFLSFGADLDAELTEKKTKITETPKRLTFDHDVLEEHFLRSSELTWEIENRGGTTRAVYVVLHLDRNAKVEGADELDFDTAASRPVAVFRVEAKKRVSRVFTATEGLSRRTSFSAVTAERLLKLAAETDLPATERGVATEAAARQGELEASHKEVEALRGEIHATEKDLERLREHLRAMGGEKGATGGGQNPFVKRILEKEDLLATQRKKLDGLEKDTKRRVEAVRTVLVKLKK